MRITTKRGYDFGEVSSAMQKAIRRGDTRLAGHWALELRHSGYLHHPRVDRVHPFDKPAEQFDTR